MKSYCECEMQSMNQFGAQKKPPDMEPLAGRTASSTCNQKPELRSNRPQNEPRLSTFPIGSGGASINLKTGQCLKLLGDRFPAASPGLQLCKLDSLFTARSLQEVIGITSNTASALDSDFARHSP
jgi:hypothetical protein